MNPPRKKVILFTRFLFALLAFGVTVGVLMKTPSNSAGARGYQVATTQDDEKSLNIERYPNEPLELIDITIRDHSVKDAVKTKIKDNHDKPVLDSVRFKENEDWFKHVKIRLRNVSGKPISGVNASLLFRPGEWQMMFAMELRAKGMRNLFQHPLEAGDEIDFEITEKSINDAMHFMSEYSVDPNQTSVTLSVRTAYFSEDSGWSQGVLIHRNRHNPNNWDADDSPEPSPTPPPEAFLKDFVEASQLFQQAGFKTYRIHSTAFSAPQFLNRCQAAPAHANLISWACNYDENNSCDTISQQGSGLPGYYSSFGIPGKCTYHPGPTQTLCDTDTVNYLLQLDSSCATPSPTPTCADGAIHRVWTSMLLWA